MPSREEAVRYLRTVSTAYQPCCILGAAAELDLFTAIIRARESTTAAALAVTLRTNERNLTVLLDALCHLGFLVKETAGSSDAYRLAEGYEELLDSDAAATQIPYIRHMMNCLRSWSQLAWTVKSGVVAPSFESLLGGREDYRSFIQAMNAIGRELAGPLVERMQAAGLLNFRNFLDLGGASGTYTLAFLRAVPEACGTIFDLPIAIQEAKNRLAKEPDFAKRITLVEGDFYRDELPEGFDAVWVSAIIHQHDRSASRTLYAKARRALKPGGRLLVRDVFFGPDRTGPAAASLFSVNMMANTTGGMVYTAAEVCEDLTAAGFEEARLVLPADDMSAVVLAVRPK